MKDQVELSSTEEDFQGQNMNRNEAEQINEEEKQKEKPNFRYLWKNFASNTTAHGFSQLLLSQNLYVRCFWIAAIIGCQVLLYLQIYPLVVRYLQKPTKTQISLQDESYQMFPMTTICNTNAIKRSMLETLKLDSRFTEEPDLLKETSDKRRRKRRSLSQLGPNPNYTKFLLHKNEEFETDETMLDEYETENKILSRLATIAQMNSKEVYQYGYQLDEIMEECVWKSVYSCGNSKWWMPVWHWKYGNCYTFNMDRKIANSTDETKMNSVSSAGPDQGLELTLKLNLDEYFNSPMSDTGAIILNIADQGERIEPFANGFSLAPSFAHYIGLEKTEITRADPFNNQSCMRHKKFDLGPRSFSYRYIDKYSVRVCRDICLAEELIKQCGCTTYTLPSLNGNRTCNTNDTACAEYYWQQAADNKLQCLQNCRLPCLETKYQLETSFRKYPVRLMPKGQVGPPTDEVLKVSIYFKTLETKIIKDEEYYFLENLLGDIGGQLGLFSGVSLLTVVEVMFLMGQLVFIIALYLNWVVGFTKNKIISLK